MHLIPEKSKEIKLSEILKSNYVAKQCNSYKSMNNNEFYIENWTNSSKFKINEDISKIEENEEFSNNHNILFDEDDYEEDDNESEDDFESYCDFSEKEMLENASALPLKLFNINNLDYVQLRDMIRRETKKRRTTKKRNTSKKSEADSALIDSKLNLNGSELNLILSKLDPEKNLGKGNSLQVSTNINSTKQSNLLSLDNFVNNTNENKNSVLSDQTHIKGNNTIDLTTRNTNFQTSSFVNMNASSLSEPKIKQTKTTQEKDRCNII